MVTTTVELPNSADTVMTATTGTNMKNQLYPQHPTICSNSHWKNKNKRLVVLWLWQTEKVKLPNKWDTFFMFINDQGNHHNIISIDQWVLRLRKIWIHIKRGNIFYTGLYVLSFLHWRRSSVFIYDGWDDCIQYWMMSFGDHKCVHIISTNFLHYTCETQCQLVLLLLW